MGQKVNPVGFRLGKTRTWNSSWGSANLKDYSNLLHEDLQLKRLLSVFLYDKRKRLLYCNWKRVNVKKLKQKYVLKNKKFNFKNRSNKNKFLSNGFYRKKILFKKSHISTNVKSNINVFSNYIKRKRLFKKISKLTAKFTYLDDFKKLKFNKKKNLSNSLSTKSFFITNFITRCIVKRWSDQKMLVCIYGFGFGPKVLRNFKVTRIKHFHLLKVKSPKKPKQVLVNTTFNNTLFLKGYKSPFFKKASSLEKIIEAWLQNKTQVRIFYIPILIEYLTDANLLSSYIAHQLEINIRSLKRILHLLFNELIKQKKLKGIKIECRGRFTKKSRMTQKVWRMSGHLPLSTVMADIDYSAAEAYTKKGVCSVKVWLYHGNKLQIWNKQNVNQVRFTNGLYK